MFNSATMNPGYVRALMSLCALGLVKNNIALATSAALEMLKLSPETLVEYDGEVHELVKYVCLAQVSILIIMFIFIC